MSTSVKSVFESTGSVDEVFGVLTSKEWVDIKAARFGDGALLKAHSQRPDGGVQLLVSRQLPDGVPGFLQRFLPSDGRVVEHFDWSPAAGDGTRRGTWTADIPGAPAKLGGTMRLEPTGSGSRYTIEGDVKVSVPLVGGKAEGFIAEMVKKLAAKEHELLVTTL
ncbi:MAG: hypothetical protein JWM62_1970 [Frankiales bacterium]|jgi:hypothetical protein|nr:hypothetical protein [Frankiales bacterium]